MRISLYDDRSIVVDIAECLLDKIDYYHDSGNSLRWSCSRAIIEFLEVTGAECKLSEQIELIDKLENLWNERERIRT